MRKLLALSFFIVVFMLSGCARTISIKEPFNEADFQKYSSPGTGKIVGQAFLKTRRGDVKYAAGNQVCLIPITKYSTEVVLDAIMFDRKIKNLHEGFNRYLKIAIADGMGNFEFDNIISGEYYMWCGIFWEVPSQYGPMKTGSTVIKTMSIKDGKTEKVILTQ